MKRDRKSGGNLFLTAFTMSAGGLLCFLYGMYRMNAGLKQAAGPVLQHKIQKILQKPWQGILAGASVTALIQSSSAVTVMLVGMADAGMISLAGSIGIILGADLGTTCTAWLLHWTALRPASSFSWSMMQPQILLLASLLLGFLLPKCSWKYGRACGNIFLGFGILWCGMQSMNSGIQPLIQQPVLFQQVSESHQFFTYILAGTVFTALVQSSSAAVGVLQVFSMSGLMDWKMCIPLLLGVNLGTCATAVLAGLRVRREAGQVAVLHILIKVRGILWGTVLFYIWMYFSGPSLENSVYSMQIAGIYTMFNLLNLLLLYPWQKQLVYLAQRF